MSVPVEPLVPSVEDARSAAAVPLVVAGGKTGTAVIKDIAQAPGLITMLNSAVRFVEATWTASKVERNKGATNLCFEIRKAYHNIHNAHPQNLSLHTREFQVIREICRFIQEARNAPKSEGPAPTSAPPSAAFSAGSTESTAVVVSTPIIAPPVVPVGPVTEAPVRPSKSKKHKGSKAPKSKAIIDSEDDIDEVRRGAVGAWYTKLIRDLQAMSVDDSSVEIITCNVAPSEGSSKAPKRAETMLLSYEDAGVDPSTPQAAKARHYANKKARQEIPPVLHDPSPNFEVQAAERRLAQLRLEQADYEFRVAFAQQQLDTTLQHIAEQLRIVKGKGPVV
ncbi:hypothetical protein JR316_0001573 [Psilocybe cubensis]|uniref:Uncharacterized protein n=3 Tax=Psilocybe cubensis TaxID=181762 RepID=A0A8H8CNM8_PSICU|nr:hypothetical protein JR316_0001571 [Psilocybe cubensis]XP_047752299.1 hypothetical protein JR316_0001573 [Psilocybe cubensis]KAH9484672.1 hypothetical protein JR316_0001571 [Psilocybe cubensis]KAH9484674.1 hypothetical protein JR316_0001573 [Psilocybe cubensis]